MVLSSHLPLPPPLLPWNWLVPRFDPTFRCRHFAVRLPPLPPDPRLPRRLSSAGRIVFSSPSFSFFAKKAGGRESKLCAIRLPSFFCAPFSRVCEAVVSLLSSVVNPIVTGVNQAALSPPSVPPPGEEPCLRPTNCQSQHLRPSARQVSGPRDKMDFRSVFSSPHNRRSTSFVHLTLPANVCTVPFFLSTMRTIAAVRRHKSKRERERRSVYLGRYRRPQ